MEDKDIITLYWARSQQAIPETADKYGAYCRSIIRRVLGDSRDREECLSDTWLGAWNAMPPQRPSALAVFLGRIARNSALDRYRYNVAARRNPGFEAVLEELGECAGGVSTEETADARALGAAIAAYLDTVSPEARRMFLWRYWHCASVGEIAERSGSAQGKVKSLLYRTRRGLREFLIREGYAL